jgi:hypothetical protein
MDRVPLCCWAGAIAQASQTTSAQFTHGVTAGSHTLILACTSTSVKALGAFRRTHAARALPRQCPIMRRPGFSAVRIPALRAQCAIGHEAPKHGGEHVNCSLCLLCSALRALSGASAWPRIAPPPPPSPLPAAATTACCTSVCLPATSFNVYTPYTCVISEARVPPPGAARGGRRAPDARAPPTAARVRQDTAVHQRQRQKPGRVSRNI